MKDNWVQMRKTTEYTTDSIDPVVPSLRTALAWLKGNVNVLMDQAVYNNIH